MTTFGKRSRYHDSFKSREMRLELGHEDRADFDPKNPLKNRAAFERQHRRTFGKQISGFDGEAVVPFSVKDEFKELLGAGNYRWDGEKKVWKYKINKVSAEMADILTKKGVKFQ